MSDGSPTSRHLTFCRRDILTPRHCVKETFCHRDIVLPWHFDTFKKQDILLPKTIFSHPVASNAAHCRICLAEGRRPASVRIWPKASLRADLAKGQHACAVSKPGRMAPRVRKDGGVPYHSCRTSRSCIIAHYNQGCGQDFLEKDFQSTRRAIVAASSKQGWTVNTVGFVWPITNNHSVQLWFIFGLTVESDL